MPLNEDDDLLTPREVAEMMGVRTTTVARWDRIGALKALVRTPGGHRRYRRTDAETFRESANSHTSPDRRAMELDATRLYEQGWSIRQVAERFDCGYGVMRRILRRHTTLRTRDEGGGRP